MQILDGWNYIAQKMTGTTSIIINNSISMQRDCAQPVFLEGMERQSCHYCSQLFTLWVYYPKSRGETKASSTAILQNLTLPSLQIDSHILPLVPEALKVKTCKWSWILPWRLSISHLWSSLQRFHSWEVLEVAWHLALFSGSLSPPWPPLSQPHWTPACSTSLGICTFCLYFSISNVLSSESVCSPFLHVPP